MQDLVGRRHVQHQGTSCHTFTESVKYLHYHSFVIYRIWYVSIVGTYSCTIIRLMIHLYQIPCQWLYLIRMQVSQERILIFPIWELSSNLFVLLLFIGPFISFINIIRCVNMYFNVKITKINSINYTLIISFLYLILCYKAYFKYRL